MLEFLLLLQEDGLLNVEVLFKRFEVCACHRFRNSRVLGIVGLAEALRALSEMIKLKLVQVLNINTTAQRNQRLRSSLAARLGLLRLGFRGAGRLLGCIRARILFIRLVLFLPSHHLVVLKQPRLLEGLSGASARLAAIHELLHLCLVLLLLLPEQLLGLLSQLLLLGLL